MSAGNLILPSTLFNRLMAQCKLKHLQLVVALAQSGSLHKAAPRVGMSQPSATSAIAGLERLLGIPLFERHSKGMRPTAAGKELVHAAQRVMDGIAASSDAIAIQLNGALGSVRLAAIPAAVSGLLRPLLPGFCERYPDILVDVRECTAEELSVLRVEGSADLLFCREPVEWPEGYRFTVLIPDEHVIAVRSQHPLVQCGTLSHLDLAGQTWLSLPSDSRGSALFARCFQRDDQQPRQRLVRTRSVTMIVSMLLHEDLLVIIPVNLIRQFVEQGLLAIFPVPVPDEFGALGVMSLDKKLGRAGQLLLDYFIDEAQMYRQGLDKADPLGNELSRGQGTRLCPES